MNKENDNAEEIFTYEELMEKYEKIISLPNCNTCGIKGLCKLCVMPGQVVRFNCGLWVESEQKSNGEKII